MLWLWKALRTNMWQIWSFDANKYLNQFPTPKKSYMHVMLSFNAMWNIIYHLLGLECSTAVDLNPPSLRNSWRPFCLTLPARHNSSCSFTQMPLRHQDATLGSQKSCLQFKYIALMDWILCSNCQHSRFAKHIHLLCTSCVHRHWIWVCPICYDPPHFSLTRYEKLHLVSINMT